MENIDSPPPVKDKKKFGCLPILGIILVVVLITAVFTTWWIKHNIYASFFTPTTLNSKEQKVLDTKLAVLDNSKEMVSITNTENKLQATPYTEKGAERSINLTEKEMNFLVASDAEMAKRVVIDLAQDLVSVKLVVPVDEEFPFFGGKTLRLNMGLKLGYAEGRPIVALQGVSLGGVPLPNAWLGNMKHTNLVEEFGSETGFWKLFAEGVENISVQDGRIKVQLKE